jgi:hypothetical protein
MRRRKFETSQRKAIVVRLSFGTQIPNFELSRRRDLFALMV